MTTDPVLIGDVPATTLAARFGTPLYAYDAASIRRRFESITAAVPYEPFGLYYSCKANAALGILRLLRGLGARLDACSPGDIHCGVRAGYEGDISYVGVGASGADLAAVVAAKAFFVADSLGQLDRYARTAMVPGEIGLRVNPAIDISAKPMVLAGSWDSKFGIHAGEIPAAARYADARGLSVVGLHAHLGSDLAAPDPHLATLRTLLELAEPLHGVRFVSLGGGLGVAAAGVPDYPVAEFGRAAAAMLEGFASRTGRRLELRLEPGSYLVMDSGVLLATVTDVKPPVRVGGAMTPRYVFVDASYNHVVSAVFDATLHPVELARDRNAVTDASQPATVAGNLMQAGDIIARDRPLPAVAVGDVLVVRRCGGYSSSRSTTFNERPRPAEVLVDGADVTLLRRAETVDDLLARDLLPG